jgi:hypothetical protein
MKRWAHGQELKVKRRPIHKLPLSAICGVLVKIVPKDQSRAGRAHRTFFSLFLVVVSDIYWPPIASRSTHERVQVPCPYGGTERATSLWRIGSGTYFLISDGDFLKLSHRVALSSGSPSCNLSIHVINCMDDSSRRTFMVRY